jgi:hypothetical protein
LHLATAPSKEDILVLLVELKVSPAALKSIRISLRENPVPEISYTIFFRRLTSMRIIGLFFASLRRSKI